MPTTVIPAKTAKPVSTHTSTISDVPPEKPKEAASNDFSMAELNDKLGEAMGEPPKARVEEKGTAQAAQESKPTTSTQPSTESDDQTIEPEVEADDSQELESMLAARGAKGVKTEAKVEEAKEASPPMEDNIPSGPAGLRKLLKAEKTRAAELQKKLEELTTKTSDAAALAERLEALQKTNEDYEAKLRVLNYEMSSEYADKFQKPLEQTWAEARKFVSELTIDDGQGNKRPAEAKDFDALLGLNTGQATDKAYEMFGRAAERVLSRRDKLIEISQQSQAALAEWRDKGKEMAKQRQAETIAAQEKLEALWSSAVESGVKAYPQLFAPIDGDLEGNKLLARGIKEADEAMGDLSGLAPEQRVKIHARLRNRAAAYGREVHLRQQAEAERDELKARLAEYEASKPKPGSGGKKVESAAAPSRSHDEDTMESMLARMGDLAE